MNGRIDATPMSMLVETVHAMQCNVGVYSNKEHGPNHKLERDGKQLIIHSRSNIQSRAHGLPPVDRWVELAGQKDWPPAATQRQQDPRTHDVSNLGSNIDVN